MRQALGPGALGRPRGTGWRGRWERGSGWGTHVNPWLIHFNVWQNPLQYCKVISLQLIKKIKKQRERERSVIIQNIQRWRCTIERPAHTACSVSLEWLRVSLQSCSWSITRMKALIMAHSEFIFSSKPTSFHFTWVSYLTFWTTSKTWTCIFGIKLFYFCQPFIKKTKLSGLGFDMVTHLLRLTLK